jgi:predicted ATPase
MVGIRFATTTICVISIRMGNSTTPIRVVITGGPGAGKTALLEALETRGYAVASEVAREIIAERRAMGLAPRPAPAEFARMIVERDIERYGSAPLGASVVFYDRSVIDSLGMLAQQNSLSESEKANLLSRYSYHPTAFILPPWPEIYRTDDERDQSFHEAVSVFRFLRGWYAECGYNLIEVPTGTVDQRCEFVKQALAAELESRIPGI